MNPMSINQKPFSVMCATLYFIFFSKPNLHCTFKEVDITLLPSQAGLSMATETLRPSSSGAGSKVIVVLTSNEYWSSDRVMTVVGCGVICRPSTAQVSDGAGLTFSIWHKSVTSWPDVAFTTSWKEHLGWGSAWGESQETYSIFHFIDRI